jgi:hypothetical protein
MLGVPDPVTTSSSPILERDSGSMPRGTETYKSAMQAVVIRQENPPNVEPGRLAAGVLCCWFDLDTLYP